MTDKQRPSDHDARVRELLAAIKADMSITSGSGGCRAEPSFTGSWQVKDKDCAERVRKAAAAVNQSIAIDNARTREPDSRSDALLQELLAAIEANKPFATGTGRCADVLCFDRHDREVEYNRPGWEMVCEDQAKRVEKAAAELAEVVEDGV